MSLLKLNKIFTISIITAFSLTAANANTCEKRVFNLKINEQVSVQEILTQLSDMCHFSVVTKDQFAKDAISEPLFGINIKDKTLNEIFSLLLSEKDMSYTFSQDILKISSLQTKTFKIDYITSVREGTAITKASVDSAPIEVGSETEDDGEADVTKGGGKLDNIIRTIEKFDFWEKLDTEIKAILNNTTESIVAPDPIINANAGLVTVTGTAAQLRRVSDYIKDIQERLKKQVIIDVSIVSVELANSYTKGIDWSKFSIGFKTGLANGIPLFSEQNSNGGSLTWSNRGNSFSRGFNRELSLLSGFNFNLDGVLNFLETNGKTKVISSPKITTLNNQQALISVGDNVNYRVQEESQNNNSLNGKTTITYKQYSVFIGILLNILPEVSDDNKIMLRINPSLSSFKYNEDDVRQSTKIREIAPDTIQKKLSTVVQVNSGDTIVLGGLIAQSKGKENTKVPFLGDIPVFGNAFKSTKDNIRTTELVFIITPRIVDVSNATPVNQSLKDLGFSRSIYGQ
ncbi:pilus (MSHA type) biogenesis protein MshL [Campylobacter rectus]|jgi:pilus (MSHA type) biogenesis protein MshL|uniref:Transformation system, type II secretion system secretin protein CtsD n=1 Tax=Campylobacter rectus TaxID=203 RepID=A0A6G5QN40_CAMRE|nr:pilus (MSHA type) biogenesis protein MshL [Campylobacter rectus]QCD47090.1 transformation system, type II secretion system secretin protein CtsD [Campylobacter rectus]UEB47791.1 pilus (MSHA type) biogenesis protein MshL [Campylobacter rectus]